MHCYCTLLLYEMNWSNYSLVQEISLVTENLLKSHTQKQSYLILKLILYSGYFCYLLYYFLFIFKHLLQHLLCLTISVHDTVQLLII